VPARKQRIFFAEQRGLGWRRLGSQRRRPSARKARKAVEDLADFGLALRRHDVVDLQIGDVLAPDCRDERCRATITWTGFAGGPLGSADATKTKKSRRSAALCEQF